MNQFLKFCLGFVFLDFLKYRVVGCEWVLGRLEVFNDDRGDGLFFR